MSNDRSFSKIKVLIDDVDITDCWTRMDIFQALDSPTWSCSVEILDSQNLIENLPILHGSQIKIIVETMDGSPTDDNVEFIFYIYKIGNKQSQNQKVESYDLKGVSKAFLLNNTIRINQKYSGLKTTDIISDISKTSFPEMNFEIGTESDNTNEILINNWSPFISIGWLLKQTHKDSRADFMFFQSDVDTFKVDSIETMYADSKNLIAEIITYKIENVGDKNYYNILKHEWDHVDVQQNLQNGYYKSTVASYDFLNKSFGETVYSHGDDNKSDLQIAKQWQDSLFDNSEKAVISFVPKMPKIFSSNTGYDDADKWIPSRRAVLQRLDSEKFSAQLRGSVGVYRWLGKSIFINLPNNTENSPEFYSRFRKGYYLVTAITHHFTPSMYINNYEFVKMRVEE